MIGVFAAARLQKPDISILSDEFLAEVCGLPHRNLAVKLLRKLLTGELSTRQRRNMVQARSFAEMREHTIRKWQNRAVEAAQLIEELIQLTRDWRGICARPIRATSQRGSMLCETLGGDARASRGRNCRYLDRNGRGCVLTVGTGLGYGLSREPGVAERGSAGRERVDKSEIAGHVADRTGVARSAARDAVDAVFEVIGEAVARGEEVRIVGFGTFSVPRAVRCARDAIRGTARA